MPKKTETTTDSLSGASSHGREGILYAPFVSEDIITQSMGPNLSRANQGKALYPLICQNDQDKALLEQYRQNMIKEFTQMDVFGIKLKQLISEGHTLEQIREGNGPEIFDKAMVKSHQFKRMIDVLGRMEIRSNEGHQELTKLLPEKHKLYITGHGGPGLSYLAADAECKTGMVTAEELALQLSEGALHPAFHDFRANACYSADTRLPTSFNSKKLKQAAKPDILRTGGGFVS